MFCGKCGTEVQNGAAFCPNCGERLNIAHNTQKNENKSNTTVNKKKTKKLKPIIALAVVIVISIVAIALVHNGNNYETVLDNYFKAIETHDAQLMKSVFADYWIDYEVADYNTDVYLLSDLEDFIEDELYDYDCGDYVQITYTVLDERRADKEDLISLKDNIYAWYGYYVYDIDDFNKSITDAYVVNVRFTVVGDDYDKFTTELLLIKENGKWKLSAGWLDNSFYSNQ